MLSLETERRLSRLLFQIAECERSVERSREDLCSNPNFDVYSIFRILDSRTNGSLEVSDLKIFLSHCGLSATRASLQLLINQYDSNGDSKLSLEEFQCLVLPAEAADLRRLVLSRNIYPVTAHVENTLARHLELEASYQSQLSTLKKSLCSRPDFSAINAFRAVDVDRLNFINVYEIRDYLRRNGYSSTMQDLEGIIRRIDTDCDSRISYEEFAAYVLHENRVAGSPSPKSYASPVKRSASRGSPGKSLQSSPKKESAKKKNDTSQEGSPTKKDSGRSSPAKKSQGKLSRSVRSRLFDTVPTADMRQVVKMFVEQVGIDSEVERQKIELAKKVDFNLLDFFRLFDINDKNYVVAADIEGLLQDLRIPYSIDEVYMLLRRFSSYKDSRIRYSDFERMYSPRDRYFAQILKEKRSREVPAYDRLRVFGIDTIDEITRIIRLQLRCENVAESLRRQITLQKWINLYEVFQEIDRDRDGLISIGELQDIMKNYGEFPSIAELEMLIERYDKDFDRKVSYSEFIEEITPKLY